MIFTGYNPGCDWADPSDVDRLLFLCAGSLIYGCHHEQDMRYMGGLRTKMPVTFWCYTIGALALAGIAPLSGFFSKDAILGAASEQEGGLKVLYYAGLTVAFMTACYMGRAYLMTFEGPYRGEADAHAAPEPVAATPASHHRADDGHGHATPSRPAKSKSAAALPRRRER